MNFHLLTLFPDMFTAVSEYGITGRAVKRQLVTLTTWNPRDFTVDKHRSVDDRPYGGGPGMVMRVEPLRQAIHAAKARCGKPCQVVYLTPQGRRFDQDLARRWAQAEQDLILIAGRYEGVDQRLIDSEVDQEISLGDFVLSGGELAAMAIVDAVTRLLPEVLGHDESASQDSFMDGLLDYPHYTRPENLAGQAVPQVLVQGDHAAIQRWRHKQALGRTWLNRPDLLDNRALDREQQGLLNEFIQEYTGQLAPVKQK